MGMEDMTPLIISRIEKNQRHVCDAELLMLAKALHVSMEWLVGDTDEIKLKQNLSAAKKAMQSSDCTASHRPTGQIQKCYEVDLHGIVHSRGRLSPSPGSDFFDCVPIVRASSFCMEDKRTAALIYSKPPLIEQACQKCCCTTAFFFCRHPAVSIYHDHLQGCFTV